MRIADKCVFLENNCVITVKTKGGGNERFVVALNFPLGNYYKVLCLTDEINSTDSIPYKLECAAKAVAEILQSSDKAFDYIWVLEHIGFTEQLDILSEICNATYNLINRDCLRIPDIEVKNNPPSNGEAKEHKKKSDEIKRLSKLLSGKRTVQLMDEIAIVMSKTNNSYADILKMPILVFKDIVRTVIINENRLDDDYNLAYLKYECEKYKIELKDLAEEKPAHSRGADIKKFHQLFG